MLLRTTALALLSANLLYFGWSQGLLAPVGLGPDTQREPQRLAQQVRAEALRVTQTAAAPAPAEAPAAATAPMAPATSSATGAAAAPACLQAGPFDPVQAEALRHSLLAAQLPEGAWALEHTAAPSRWIVYMGKYTDPEVLEKKRAELRALRVETAPIGQPALAPGLSLGVFSSAAGAQEHLAQMTRRGVRTARVVPEQPDHAVTQLRLPSADEALRAQVQALVPGKTLSACS